MTTPPGGSLVEEPPQAERKTLAYGFSEKKIGRTAHRHRQSGTKMMFGVTMSFSLGLRFFFLAFPTALWIVGTPGLWIGTFCVLSFHLVTDYVWHDDPENGDEENGYHLGEVDV